MPTPSPIKQRIQELVPEIMELKKGCIIQEKDNPDSIASRLDPINLDVVEVRRGWIWCYLFTNLLKEPYITGVQEGKAIILGRPITLADVLRAIDEVLKIKGHEDSPGRTSQVFIDNQGRFVEYGYGNKTLAQWNLAIPDLDGQSEELKNLVGDLLGVKSQL